MTLEEAIKHAEEKAKYGGKCGEDHAQLAEWLKELKERRAAELEKRTEERTKTHACDCISRQAAIDEVINLWADKPFGNPALVEIKDCIEKLPPAQPEIIRCKDCKHRDVENGFCEGRGWPMQLVPDDGFCDKGERRTDE